MGRIEGDSEEGASRHSFVDPAWVAVDLGFTLSELAVALRCRNWQQPEAWQSPDLQRKLTDIRGIAAVLSEMKGESPDVLVQLGKAPVRALHGMTMLQAIGAGETGRVLRYLQSISGGQNG